MAGNAKRRRRPGPKRRLPGHFDDGVACPMECGTLLPSLDFDEYAEHFNPAELPGLMRKLSGHLARWPGAQVIAWVYCHGCGFSGPIMGGLDKPKEPDGTEGQAGRFHRVR